MPISSQSSDSIFTTWKSRIRKPDGDSNQDDVSITIPKVQIMIIKASLAELEASLDERGASNKE